MVHTPKKIPYRNYKGLKGDKNPLYAILQIRDFFVEITGFPSRYKGFRADKGFSLTTMTLKRDEK